ncbi:MAG: hypothetical protein WAV90_11550 [Gordonia amarae]
MNIDTPEFRNAVRRLAELGQQAGMDMTQGITVNLAPPGATSPVGIRISMVMGQLQVQLLPPGMSMTQDAIGLGNRTDLALNGIDQQDMDNGQVVQATKEADPQSFDQQGQQLMQMLTQGIQAGVQAGQQLAQQLGQIPSQLGQAVGQIGQQLGQVMSQVAESATDPADMMNADLGGDLGPDLGDVGGGGGLGGETTPAGLGGSLTPFTTSAALQNTAMPAQATSTAGTALGRSMPMMPMSPMHGMHGKGKGDKTAPRDPVIFPESPLYEAGRGVEQVFGINPVIESEEPPFGDTESEGVSEGL